MNKIYKILLLILFVIIPSTINAHVQHYDNLNRVEFDIYRNNHIIGKHIFSFNKSNGHLKVESEIKFKIRKFGIDLYKYHVKGIEVYQDGVLMQFNSKTNQNGKEKYVNLILKNDELEVDGSSFKGKVSNDYMLGTWWNHSIVQAKAQISAVSGRIIRQKVTFLGKEKIKIGEKIYNTLHFNFSSIDKKLNKDKKLNTHVWYDEKTLNWVKSAFNKKGKWEYKLVSAY